MLWSMVVHSIWCFVTLVQHSVSTASKLRKIKQSETNCASNFSPHPQAQGPAAHCTLNVTRLCSSPRHMSRVHKTEVDILIDPSIQLTMRAINYCPQSTPIPCVHWDWRYLCLYSGSAQISLVTAYRRDQRDSAICNHNQPPSDCNSQMREVRFPWPQETLLFARFLIYLVGLYVASVWV